MPQVHDRWTVMPHGPVEAVDDRILTVVGEIPMPLGKFPRRMTVVGLTRNRTAVFSAMALDEPSMKRVEGLGKPAFLIVPNGHHRLDAPAWKKRYPGIKVICPAGARDKVADVLPVDATENVIGDGSVDFVVADGTGNAEAALLVRRKSGTTLIVNDLIGYVRRPQGIGAKLIARLFAFGIREPQVPRVVRRIMVDDAGALARQFRAWAKVPGLKRILVSHGDPIAKQPARMLERLAGKLEG